MNWAPRRQRITLLACLRLNSPLGEVADAEDQDGKDHQRATGGHAKIDRRTLQPPVGSRGCRAPGAKSEGLSAAAFCVILGDQPVQRPRWQDAAGKAIDGWRADMIRGRGRRFSRGVIAPWSRRWPGVQSCRAWSWPCKAGPASCVSSAG